MKINIYLINGRVMQLQECTCNDFKLLTKEFSISSKFFVWNEKFCIRKSEVLGFEIVEEEQPIQPPVPQ